MAGNRFVDQNRSESGKQNVTSITRSQRSTCNVVIYRWAEDNITKINVLDVTGKKGFTGQGQEAVKGNFAERSRVVIKNDVVRANITKSKSGNAGNFSFTLKRGKEVVNNQVQLRDIDYLDVIHPGDWVMIYMKKGGTVNVDSIKQESGFKCLGIIRNVRYVEVDDPETGRPRLEYVVTGEDFGAVFDADIFFNPKLNQKAAQTLLGANFLVDSIKSVNGSERPSQSGIAPDTMIRKMVGFYLGGAAAGEELDDLNITHQAWYIPPKLSSKFGVQIKNKKLGVSFVDILNTDRIGLHSYNRNGEFRGASKLPGGAFIKALPSSGSVWQILSTMNNNIANEMYTELVPDSNGNLRPSIIMRQVPFSNRPGETNAFSVASQFNEKTTNELPQSSQKTFITDLPRHIIKSSDVKSKNIGKSEHERINHILTVPKIEADAENLAFTAVTNVPSIQRYGLKSYQGQTQYVLDKTLGNPKKACTFFAHLLTDWFLLSHLFYNGTIVIDGSDLHFQIGNNLYIEDIGQLFHIEGYNHTFTNRPEGPTEFTTELTVSRGHFLLNNRARFIGPSAASVEPTTITTSVLERTRL